MWQLSSSQPIIPTSLLPSCSSADVRGDCRHRRNSPPLLPLLAWQTARQATLLPDPPGEGYLTSRLSSSPVKCLGGSSKRWQMQNEIPRCGGLGGPVRLGRRRVRGAVGAGPLVPNGPPPQPARGPPAMGPPPRRPVGLVCVFLSLIPGVFACMLHIAPRSGGRLPGCSASGMWHRPGTAFHGAIGGQQKCQVGAFT